MLRLIPLGFGLLMAIIDVFMLSTLKLFHVNGGSVLKYVVFPTLIYALQPWIFYNALSFESMTVINIVWDLLSVVLATGIGVFYFKETICKKKQIGIALAVGAIILMAFDD